MKTETIFPEACEYLEQVQEAERGVERLEQRIENLRMVTTDTSVHLTDLPHAPSPDQQKLLTILAEIDELERELDEAKLHAAYMRMAVGAMICQLDNPMAQRVLLLHYLEGKSWKEISLPLNCSIAQVYRFRYQGLDCLSRMLESA